jgi:hypothetical protein
MSVNGAQLLMRAGSRVYFKRASVGTTHYPLVDLGALSEDTTPSIETEKAETYDPDGGVNTLLNESVTKLTEKWQFSTKNVSLENLNMAFLGSPAADLARTADPVTFLAQPTANVHVGRLLQICDGNGDAVRKITSLQGVYAAPVDQVGHGANMISLATADLPRALAAGDVLVVRGDTGLVTATTFTVVSTTTNGANTEVTVTESAADCDDDGTISLKLVADTDYVVKSLDRGLIKLIAGLVDGDAITISYTPAVLSGARKIYPLTGSTITGAISVIISADNYGTEMVREARCSLTMTGLTLGLGDDNTIAFEATIIKDETTALAPYGALTHYLGDLPATA